MVDVDIATWYERYLPLVLRRCRAMLGAEEDAFDAAQDVFERAWKARKKLHGGYPSTLLYTIATRVCLNRLRYRKRRRAYEPAHRADEDAGVEPLFVERGFEAAEARMMIDSILKNASESTRALLFMYYVDGMTLEEAGAAAGLSISGTRKRLASFTQKARKEHDWHDD